MKKTIAAGGASLLGLSAFGVGALPAQAAEDPVVDPCLDANDHVLTVGGVSSNWYMDCVPQYAIGSVEFTITSETPLPDDFLALNDPGVTSTTTNTGAAADAYFGNTPPPAGFVDMFELGGSETTRSYLGAMMLKVASVGAVATSELPAGCTGGTYTGGYVVNYTPATVSFTQVIDGVEWRYDVVATPQPLYLGLSILDTGVFDPTGSMCASSGGNTIFAIDAVGDGAEAWSEVGSIATTGLFTLTPFFGEGKTLPDVSRYVAPPPEPQLAATGVSPAGTLGVAALFLALGVAGGYLKRRRVAD